MEEIEDSSRRQLISHSLWQGEFCNQIFFHSFGLCGNPGINSKYSNKEAQMRPFTIKKFS